MFYKDYRIHSELPKQVVLEGRTVHNPKWKHCEAAGWKLLPDGLVGVPLRHIKWVDGDPVEMSDEEKTALEPFPEETLEEIAQLRRATYQEEADPIFFRWQRGEATEEEWLAKVDEIKARYPKPVGE